MWHEIWDKQIGDYKDSGFDFSGREIHKEEYNNSDSPFGWTLLEFDKNDFLIVHIDTKKELPDDLINNEGVEFFVNGKIFNFTKNSKSEWDVNSIEYDEQFIPSSRSSKNDNQNINNETEIFSFNNKHDTSINDMNTILKDQEKEIKRLQDQLINEQNNEIYKRKNHLDNLRNEELINKQIEQTKEIEYLEEKLRMQEQKTRQIEIQKNNERLNELKQKIAQIQQLNFLSSLNLNKTQNNLTSNISIINNDKNSSSFNDNIINDLYKKLDEQTKEIEFLGKLKSNKESKKNNNFDSVLAQKMWNLNFKSNNLGTDFAGIVVVKDKFGLNDEEGGWNLEYFDRDNSLESFIASSKAIKARNGKDKFTIDNFDYYIKNISGKWEINKVPKGQNFNYSSKNIEKIAETFKPNNEKGMSSDYHYYSSLMLNLYHFPLVYLEKFESFLKETLSGLSFFNELFIYSNEGLYRAGKSNISSYARIFFKSDSIKNDIEILITTLSLKKGMMSFINNFQQTNKHDEISFSMVLMNFQRSLKFIHAQTNFELLKSFPVPESLPLRRLIIDSEYNSILKFHKNDFWKKIKPYALDYKGNTYYVCDIDSDELMNSNTL